MTWYCWFYCWSRQWLGDTLSIDIERESVYIYDTSDNTCVIVSNLTIRLLYNACSCLNPSSYAYAQSYLICTPANIRHNRRYSQQKSWALPTWQQTTKQHHLRFVPLHVYQFQRKSIKRKHAPAYIPRKNEMIRIVLLIVSGARMLLLCLFSLRAWPLKYSASIGLCTELRI